MGIRGLKSASILLLLLLATLRPVPCQSGSFSGPIKTVVVLVMENRSFDHMLGWMKQLNPEINGVTGTEMSRLNASDPNSQLFVFGNKSQYVDPDPGHSFQAIREQIFGSDDVSADPAPMNGFAQQAYGMTNGTAMSEDVMNGFPPEAVVVYKSLVSEFAVFDRWFAAVPASTQPNRLYVHSATSHGAVSNIGWKLALGYPQRTIFDSLHDDGMSFKIYFQNIPATLFYSSLRKIQYVPNFQPFDQFRKDAESGSLPNYVVLEQRYMDMKIAPANDDHPTHDVYQGQLLIKEVYETLRASPQWNESVLIITYDEHGGYYDHVPTPVRGVPSPDGIIDSEPFNFKFDRLGVRVPTIMVSPWIEKGTVVHGPNGSPYPSSEFEHSSIPGTVKKLFNLSSDFLTKRDAWAGTFETLFQKRTSPRTDCPVNLPNPSKIRTTEANEDAKMSEFQQELMQLAAALVGHSDIAGFAEKIAGNMTVREGNQYMEDAVKRFLDAGLEARRMGVDGDQIVQMRPSMTTQHKDSTVFP